MTKTNNKSKERLSPLIERLIDANLNRLKEGLRVVEDICRYVYNDKHLTSEIKILRHKLQISYSIDRLQHRDIVGDVQKTSTQSELSRLNLNDILIANFSRAEESSRVLEEIFKLQDTEQSELFKQIRYQLYDIEKRYFQTYT
ncbi:MAG TPA: thiamine-phosphate pyrophosphorylase [Campylobacterales bacterium]|nr:thiamine-phosphate pyrophosphorylase [Campylobacterales bacterium]HIP41601.1 thiamine-phosphate pyrophosphorylase [Campylobacterales bacterium]